MEQQTVSTSSQEESVNNVEEELNIDEPVVQAVLDDEEYNSVEHSVEQSDEQSEDDEEEDSDEEQEGGDSDSDIDNKVAIDLSDNDYYKGLCTLLEDEHGNNILEYISLLHTELIGVNKNLRLVRKEMSRMANCAEIMVKKSS